MKKRVKQICGLFVIVLMLFLLIGCHRRPLEIPTDIQLKTLDVDGIQRNYYLHVPLSIKTEGKVPIVMVLHGGGKGDGLTPEKNLGFTQLSDREGFIVVYPNGIGAHWNDGRGYTYRGPSDTTVDDVGFISQLIDYFIQNKNVDPAKIYVTGISNGGMMTLRLGCELSSKLAAIAAIVANIPKNIIGSCKPNAKLPVLLMNGTEDPLVPYDGGYVRFLNTRMGEVVSTAETVSFWVKHNGCDSIPSVINLPDIDPGDHSTVTVSRYGGANDENEVLLYTINGGGHNLPGSNTPDISLLLGHKNGDINGAEVIWKFFKRHSR